MRTRFVPPVLGLVAALVLAPALAPAAVGVAADWESVSPAASGVQPGGPCAGHMTERPDGLTVVSVQGANGRNKTRARVVAFHPNGSIAWVHENGRELGVVWSYDVDPLPNGNLFVVGTVRRDGRGQTLLYELDADTGEVVWRDVVDMLDTHDADVLNRTHVVVANMRNYDAANDTNDDRIAIYNRTSDRVEWSWYFRDHYARSVGGSYEEDWTHVNDVDRVGPNHFLVSPRNLDQVILINRTSGEIELKLGSDGDHSVLHKQHNPDYLASDEGDPTFLVADSENDRIVEYEYSDGDWRRTWTAGSDATLQWPRDADRLPDGDTLVADSRNDRVVEVAPDGEVVWEVYAPYLVYDVERLPGDGSRGPTMADQNAEGDVSLSNASPPTEAALARCNRAISTHEGGFSERDTDATPTGTQTTYAGDTVVEQKLTDEQSSVLSPVSPALAVVAVAVVGAVLALRRRRD